MQPIAAVEAMWVGSADCNGGGPGKSLRGCGGAGKPLNGCGGPGKPLNGCGGCSTVTMLSCEMSCASCTGIGLTTYKKPLTKTAQHTTIHNHLQLFLLSRSNIADGPL
jgi:hypothetical protein